jgi:hypothetical protein
MLLFAHMMHALLHCRPTFEDTLDFFQQNLDAHEKAARSMGKPFVVEVGCPNTHIACSHDTAC